MDNQDAPLKVIINGQEEELSADEAAQLIDTGRRTREAEAKYNTKLDKVWPDYNRSQQEKAKLEKELEEARDTIRKFDSKQQEGIETPKDIVEAKKAAKALGIVFEDELPNSGYVKKDDLDKYFEDREASKRATDQVLARADELEKSIDGSDGRPAFNKKAVLAYASSYNFSSLEDAYEDMWKTQIDNWKQAQIDEKKAKSLKTLGTGGRKEPSTPRVNKDNFRSVLRETLEIQEE